MDVLGPLFFLLFINDLPKCCPEGKVRLFADDTTIFFHSNNIKDINIIGKNIMIRERGKEFVDFMLAGEIGQCKN